MVIISLSVYAGVSGNKDLFHFDLQIFHVHRTQKKTKQYITIRSVFNGYSYYDDSL